MEDQSGNHALTEVALALAMAFFAMMVLAMVSMSVRSVVEPETLTVSEQPQQAEQHSEPIAADVEPQLIIYYLGRFSTADGKPMDLQTIDPHQALVLAIAPDISVQEALAVKAKISSPDLTITTLTPQWLNHLEKRDES
jgi:hypothetical protein